MPKTLEDLKKVAVERGWMLNPDANQVNNVLKAMNMKKEKFGDYYCPCRVQRVPENVCPCVHSPKEIEKDGRCHCNLYYKRK